MQYHNISQLHLFAFLYLSAIHWYIVQETSLNSTLYFTFYRMNAQYIYIQFAFVTTFTVDATCNARSVYSLPYAATIPLFR